MANNTTWHNNTFTLRLSVPGTDVDVKDPPNKNLFRFRAVRDGDDKIYLYKVEPLNPPDMKPGWVHFSNMLPQRGSRLRWDLATADKLVVGGDPNKVDSLARLIKEQKIDDDEFSFERLIGTVTMGGVDNPVSFYRVAKCYKKANGDDDDDRLLLIAVVTVVDGENPVGTMAAEN
jgi:hypothetical protein